VPHEHDRRADVGELRVASGSWVGSALTLNQVAAPTVLATTDFDADGAAGLDDPCPSWPNTAAELTGAGTNAAVDANMEAAD